MTNVLTLKQPAIRKVVVVTSNKGGTGKTTTSINLAVAAQAAGYDVAMVDLDDQRNLKKWAERRASKYRAYEIPCTAAPLGQYDFALSQTRGSEVVIVDTPPGLNNNMAQIAELIDVADFVLVPTQCGIFDLETVVPWSQAIQRTKANKVSFLLNRVNTRSSELREAQSVLGRYGRLCAIPVRELTAIQKYMKAGLALTDISGTKDANGKRDIEDVWHYVSKEIGL